MDCLDYRTGAAYFLAKESLSEIYRELENAEESNKKLLRNIRGLFENCMKERLFLRVTRHETIKTARHDKNLCLINNSR
ncbi:hypothetical protein J4402_01665 [Candidatus Pacearchaeota archaeon]|nr:hypothetical protein [Candidatus Pacearchaeota archaeon]